MKRFLIILTALVMMVSMVSCGNSEEVVAQDGQKIAGRDAGNEAVAYSFAYPEEWEIARNDGVVEIQFDCNASDAIAEYATMTVLGFSLSDSNVGAKDYWEEHKKEVESVFDDFELLDTEETELDGTIAYKVKYSCTMNERTHISEQIICCRFGEVYLVTLVSPEEYHDDVKDMLKTVRESFRFS